MPRFTQGTVTLSIEVRLPPVPPATVGALTDPGDIFVVLVDTVTGIQTTYDYNPGPIVRDVLGKFHLDLNLPPSFYQGYWETTGVAAGRKPIILNIAPALTPSHLSSEDVLTRLNISAATSEIEDMIASAVSEQEQWVGAIAPRTVTETLYAHHGRLSLSTRPVLSVVSATVNGSAQDVTVWRVPSAMAGLVDLHPYGYGYGYGYGGYGPFFSAQSYTVTYTAGRNPVPQDLVEAALLRVAHSYATQRGASAGGGQIIGSASGDVAEPSGSDFLLMLRAQDKEKPYVLPSVA